MSQSYRMQGRTLSTYSQARYGVHRAPFVNTKRQDYIGIFHG